MRRPLLLVAAVLVGTVAVPGSAADRPSERRSLRFDFHGRSGILLVEGRITSDARHPGLLATVSTEGTDAFFADVAELDGRGDVATFGAAGHQSLCAAPVVCSVSRDGRTLDFSASYTVQGALPLRLSEYLVLEGRTVTVTTSKLGGWSVHRTAGWSRVTNDQVSTAGVTTPAGDVEVDTSYSAKGPRTGSVAIAVPACEDVGAGVAVLSGGARSQQAVCPSYPVAAVATKATTWQVSGAVAGATADRTRLLVLAR